MPQRHEKAARIIGGHQAAQHLFVHRAAIPANLECLADLAHRGEFHVFDRV